MASAMVIGDEGSGIRAASQSLYARGRCLSSFVSAANSPGNLLLTGQNNQGIAIRKISTGETTKVLVPDFQSAGDFNGDGAIDDGFFQDGAWYVRLAGKSANDKSSEIVIQFGVSGDIPVVGDWDGDGRDNLGVFRPQQGKWYFDLDGKGALQNNESSPWSRLPERRHAWIRCRLSVTGTMATGSYGFRDLS